jgi:predicted ATPase
MMGVGNDSFDLDIIPAADFSRLEVSARLRIVAEESNVEVAPSDIGVGVSQVLPVVVGAMAPNYKILSVEQPELHIHPAIQCRLADLLALQTLCKERMVLLETHSEHLILRLLRRVRELNDGNLEPGDPEIRTDDLSILYVTSRPEGLEITELPVTEDGDFAKPWPKGFFPERTTELF